MTDVTTGLTVASMLDAVPPALRVTSIDWWSGFRDTGLQRGDQIIAVDGAVLRRPLTPEDARRESPRLIGGYQESQRWADSGKDEGASVTVTVRRRATTGRGWLTVQATGTLREPVQARSADNRILIGPGGPPEMFENDGFDASWREWAGKFAALAATVLDDPLYALAQTSRLLLRQLQDQQPRVQLLAAKYPGPFAHAIEQDFEAMRLRLQGPDVVLSDDALAYREMGEQRAEVIRQQAQAGWAALQGELADRLIAPLFPAVHPIHGDRAGVIGRHALLPPLRNRDWVGEAGRTWFVAGNASDGFYFADAEGPQAVLMLDALARYRRLVMPNIDECYELIGQVQEQPGQLVVGERAYFGLALKPVAALVGGAMFVDLRQPEGGVALFAGEQALHDHGCAAPPDSAEPEVVMQAMVSALKAADQDLWISLFATWSLEPLADGRVLFRANAVEQPARYFEEARRRIMERVFDMRPVWLDDVRVVIPGDQYPGQLRLEEVIVEMQHIGLFDGYGDGHYRAFSDVTVNRWWRLQRIGMPGALGPWRITSQQPI
ncbi:hypothetical protein [Roseateles sp.]|uniref:hypothetical protein n=1 Tax=Roseateles sp. TaxID=1971397 RepID=UPI003263CC9E